MITPELATYATVCHTSLWRPLHDAPGRPRYLIMLSAGEVAELVHTGSYSLPERDVPESVRTWRKMRSAAEVVAAPLSTGDLIEAIEETHEQYRSARLG